MRPIRVATAGFWKGFSIEEIPVRFPELTDVTPVELVDSPDDADILLYSCFSNGVKTSVDKDPLGGRPGGPIRLFYTAENVQPDFGECDYAITFSRTIVDPRHHRMPNSISALRFDGYELQARHEQGLFGVTTETPRRSGSGEPLQTAAEVRASKTRFCAYVQRNPVPFRERFVQRLSEYKRVDCAGPSLNNTGFTTDRPGKRALFRQSKFAVTFENEEAVGYTTEKLPDAIASHCVPVYWGDPTVGLDFNTEAFVRVRSEADVDAAIERIIALDQDDAAYDAMLSAPKFPNGVLPSAYRREPLIEFFRRVVQGVHSNLGSPRVLQGSRAMPLV